MFSMEPPPDDAGRAAQPAAASAAAGSAAATRPPLPRPPPAPRQPYTRSTSLQSYVSEPPSELSMMKTYAQQLLHQQGAQEAAAAAGGASGAAAPSTGAALQRSSSGSTQVAPSSAGRDGLLGPANSVELAPLSHDARALAFERPPHFQLGPQLPSPRRRTTPGDAAEAARGSGGAATPVQPRLRTSIGVWVAQWAVHRLIACVHVCVPVCPPRRLPILSCQYNKCACHLCACLLSRVWHPAVFLCQLSPPCMARLGPLPAGWVTSVSPSSFATGSVLQHRMAGDLIMPVGGTGAAGSANAGAASPNKLGLRRRPMQRSSQHSGPASPSPKARNVEASAPSAAEKQPSPTKKPLDGDDDQARRSSWDWLVGRLAARRAAWSLAWLMASFYEPASLARTAHARAPARPPHPPCRTTWSRLIMTRVTSPGTRRRRSGWWQAPYSSAWPLCWR